MTNVHDAIDLVRRVTCPACGHHVAVSFFEGDGERPGPLDVVRCVDCGHVFNTTRGHPAIADPGRPRPMIVRAPGWSEHVRSVRDEMLGRLPEAPVVVEIGHGDGQFLTALAEGRPTGRYIGFDPHGTAEARHPAVVLRRDPFVPMRDLGDLGPHLILSRYVMEYLTQPLGFIQELAFAAAWSGLQPVLYLEVPCIDRALETGRTLDFDHEHTSYFTTGSLMRMLSRCGVVEQRIGHGCHGEVLYAFVRLGRGRAQVERARAVQAFRRMAREAGERDACEVVPALAAG